MGYLPHAIAGGFTYGCILIFLLANARADPSRFPSEIRLKAGVLHAPPLAIVEGVDSGNSSFSGFQIDLLGRLKIFAAEDGIDLTVDLSPSPDRYEDAFNLIANDCNKTANPNSLEDCQKYDVLIGDYFVNSDRYMRADLSPAWLWTSISTVKHIGREGKDEFTTLEQAEKVGATVCVPKGAYLGNLLQAKFPNNQHLPCGQPTECIRLLKNGYCVLYANDELVLNYEASHDKSLEVTGESFNTQYLVWPMREDLPKPVSKLMKKWIYNAVQNATLDELFFDYFKKELCPHGTAAGNCELPCDPDHGTNSGEVCLFVSTKLTGDLELEEEVNMLLPRLHDCPNWLLAGIISSLVAICALWVNRTRIRAHINMTHPRFLIEPHMAATQILLLLLLTPVNSLIPRQYQYSSKVHLNAGVLHAPPMAIVEEMESGEIEYAGFQIDLLERLKIFAAEDGVDLNVDLSQAPPLYGDAFNLLASDCNTTANPNPQEKCRQYQMIIGDYYSSADRFMRADFSPAWMRTSMATIKYIEKEEGAPDFTILTEAEEDNATVCVPKGTFLADVVQQRFPNCQYIRCDPSTGECIDLLKAGTCVLYADDELLLQYTASKDVSLELTGESFNNQYFVWPMREDLFPPVSKLIKRWMYKAIQNATVDELYINYFTEGQCPLGTAGEQCELPCDPDHGASDPRGVCICWSPKWTGDDCSIEVPEELNLLPPRVIIACYVLAGINYTLVALCGIWLFMNRNRAQVKMAQPMFLMLILVGCLISTSTIFAGAQEDEGDGPVHACAAIPWFYSVGFSLTFGALYARIRRIYQVIRSAVEMKRITISAGETLRTVALVLAIDVVFLTVWTVVDPLKWKRSIISTDMFGEPLESTGYCSSEHWEIFAGLIASFHFILMAVACYRCYLARKIPDRISNGKYVGMAMFSNFQIFVVVIPVLFILGSADTGTSFFIVCTAIWINDFVIISLVFWNLIYKVYQNDREAESSGRLTKYSSHIKLSTEIRNYAKAVRGISRSLTMRISTAMGRGMDNSRKRDSSRREEDSSKEIETKSSTSFPGKAKKQVRILDPASSSLRAPEESPSLKDDNSSSGNLDVSFYVDEGRSRMPALAEIDSESSEDELEGEIDKKCNPRYTVFPRNVNLLVDDSDIDSGRTKEGLKVDIDQELPHGLQVDVNFQDKEKEAQDIEAGKVPSIPELPDLLKKHSSSKLGGTEAASPKQPKHRDLEKQPTTSKKKRRSDPTKRVKTSRNNPPPLVNMKSEQTLASGKKPPTDPKEELVRTHSNPQRLPTHDFEDERTKAPASNPPSDPVVTTKPKLHPRSTSKEVPYGTKEGAKSAPINPSDPGRISKLKPDSWPPKKWKSDEGPTTTEKEPQQLAPYARPPKKRNTDKGPTTMAKEAQQIEPRSRPPKKGNSDDEWPTTMAKKEEEQIEPVSQPSTKKQNSNERPTTTEKEAQQIEPPKKLNNSDDEGPTTTMAKKEEEVEQIEAGVVPSIPQLPEFLKKNWPSSKSLLDGKTKAAKQRPPRHIEFSIENDGIPAEILQQADQMEAELDDFATWVEEGTPPSEPKQHTFSRRLSDLSASSHFFEDLIQ